MSQNSGMPGGVEGELDEAVKAEGGVGDFDQEKDVGGAGALGAVEVGAAAGTCSDPG